MLAILLLLSPFYRGKGREPSDRFGKETITRLLRIVSMDELHIILLDLNLNQNDTDGFKVLQDIRQHPELAHIPVVAVTAFDPSMVIGPLKQAGFDGLISKPLRVNTFGVYINAILSGKSVWGDTGISMMS